MTPRANPPLAPEASSVPEILPPTTPEGTRPRKSSRLIKKQEQHDLINVCSSVCSAIIVAHDKTLKVTQPASPMSPPLLPVGGEAAFPRGKWKGEGKAAVKGKVQGGGDDEAVDDPSHKDNHDLSAQFIVQQAS
jgi:hypothetical protein